MTPPLPRACLEAATQALMAQLVDALGMQALALGQLIKEVRGR